MIEYERKFTVKLGQVSPHSLGTITGVSEITDYYPPASSTFGADPQRGGAERKDGDTPVARMRHVREGGRETLEITVKTRTADPAARNEWTYPIPGGVFRCAETVPQARKTRYRLTSLRGVLVQVITGAMDPKPPHAPASTVSIPPEVVCTLDVFSWPRDADPVLEIEGPKPIVDALFAQLSGLPWLSPVDRPVTRYAPRR